MTSQPKKSAAKPVGKSLSDFRAAHDKSFIVPKKINEALAALGEGWEYEAQFIRLAGLSQTDCGAYRDQFEDFIVTVGGKNPKRIWCGSTKLATQLREMA